MKEKMKRKEIKRKKIYMFWLYEMTRLDPFQYLRIGPTMLWTCNQCPVFSVYGLSKLKKWKKMKGNKKLQQEMDFFSIRWPCLTVSRVSTDPSVCHFMWRFVKGMEKPWKHYKMARSNVPKKNCIKTISYKMTRMGPLTVSALYLARCDFYQKMSIKWHGQQLHHKNYV